MTGKFLLLHEGEHGIPRAFGRKFSWIEVEADPSEIILSFVRESPHLGPLAEIRVGEDDVRSGMRDPVELVLGLGVLVDGSVEQQRPFLVFIAGVILGLMPNPEAPVVECVLRGPFPIHPQFLISPPCGGETRRRRGITLGRTDPPQLAENRSGPLPIVVVHLVAVGPHLDKFDRSGFFFRFLCV